MYLSIYYYNNSVLEKKQKTKNNGNYITGKYYRRI
jgi:hypothetical protein